MHSLSTMLPSFLILFATVFTLAAAQWPDPVPLTGNFSFVHDPSVIYKDGTYYRFSTFGEIYIASASNMTGPWSVLGRAIPGGSIINLAGNDVLWAPDVSEVNGTYYMYYAVSTSGSQDSDIGVATSTQLIPGTWTDHGSLSIPKSPSYNKIDPNLFIDPVSGTPLLTFGSYWRDIYQIPLASPPLTVAPNAVPKNIEYNGTARAGGNQQPQVMEGSYQFSYAVNGTTWYYLFWSSGDCCSVPPHLPETGDEYKVMVARSSSPTGPWVDDQGRDTLSQGGGKLVLGSHGQQVYAPGGQGIMWDERSGAPLMYYHYVDPTVGYGIYDFMFGWNWLDFGSGWPLVVENAVVNTTVAAVAGNRTATSSAAGRNGQRGRTWAVLAGLAVIIALT